MSEGNKTTDECPRLDPELKAKWLEALRSGRFNQGEKCLHEDGRYCCLGVLATVAGIPTQDIDRRGTLVVRNSPSALLSFLRADSEREIQCKLENMNDGVDGERKHSFAEIADYVEANL